MSRNAKRIETETGRDIVRGTETGIVRGIGIKRGIGNEKRNEKRTGRDGGKNDIGRRKEKEKESLQLGGHIIALIRNDQPLHLSNKRLTLCPTHKAIMRML